MASRQLASERCAPFGEADASLLLLLLFFFAEPVAADEVSLALVLVLFVCWPLPVDFAAVVVVLGVWIIVVMVRQVEFFDALGRADGTRSISGVLKEAGVVSPGAFDAVLAEFVDGFCGVVAMTVVVVLALSEVGDGTVVAVVVVAALLLLL